MQTSPSTTEQINNLIEFRQTVYTCGLTTACDAQMELIDSLLCNQRVNSFVELSPLASDANVSVIGKCFCKSRSRHQRPNVSSKASAHFLHTPEAWDTDATSSAWRKITWLAARMTKTASEAL